MFLVFYQLFNAFWIDLIKAGLWLSPVYRIKKKRSSYKFIRFLAHDVPKPYEFIYKASQQHDGNSYESTWFSELVKLKDAEHSRVILLVAKYDRS